MLRNYFKIAWRNLMKHKLFSFINIFGLASAMTVCMLALIKIKDAFDYDRFHPNSNRTYRITTGYTSKKGEPSILLASSPFPLGQYLKDNYPVIDKTTTIHFLRGDVTGNYKTLLVSAVCLQGCHRSRNTDQQCCWTVAPWRDNNYGIYISYGNGESCKVITYRITYGRDKKLFRNTRENPLESQGTSSINILDLSIGLRIVGIK